MKNNEEEIKDLSERMRLEQDAYDKAIKAHQSFAVVKPIYIRIKDLKTKVATLNSQLKKKKSER